MLKIVSGGQTGVDRAALDIAGELGIPYGGWCPRGGWAEDLPRAPGLLAFYPHLQETPDLSPRQRTKWNVRDSDCFLVLTGHAGLSVSRGTEAAVDLADRLDKPYILIDLDATDALDQALAWIGGERSQTVICIGGPRESEAPGIYAKAKPFLHALLTRISGAARPDEPLTTKP